MEIIKNASDIHTPVFRVIPSPLRKYVNRAKQNIPIENPMNLEGHNDPSK